MFDKEEKEEIIESPKKIKNLKNFYQKEDENTNNLSSKYIEINAEHQINNQFSSPIQKKFKYLKIMV